MDTQPSESTAVRDPLSRGYLALSVGIKPNPLNPALAPYGVRTGNHFPMNTDTPRTDELYKKIWLFTNDQPRRPLCEMRDFARELERENARLREAIADLHAIADSSYGAADHETQAAFESWMKGNRSLLPNAPTSDAPSALARRDN